MWKGASSLHLRVRLTPAQHVNYARYNVSLGSPPQLVVAGSSRRLTILNGLPLMGRHTLRGTTGAAMLEMASHSPMLHRQLPGIMMRDIGHPFLRRLRCFGRTLVPRYRELTAAYPFSFGFGVCFFKGILADILAQKVIARKKELDRRQVLAMGLFSGSFTGCAYHYIFNIVFTRLLGTSTSLSVVSAKTLLDAFIVFPFLYMPTYYFFDEVFKQGGASGLPARWCNEIATSMRNYANVWPATMVCVFMLVPVELRVSFIASVSFGWLITLSLISH